MEGKGNEMPGVESHQLKGLSRIPIRHLVNNRLEEIVKTSPRIAALLPEVMRHLANELETMSEVDCYGKNITDKQALQSGTESEDLTHMVVSQISAVINTNRSVARNGTIQECSEEKERLLQDILPSVTLLTAADTGAGTGTDTSANSQPSKPHMHLKLLGQPEISFNGTRLTSVERCSRAAHILYILALHRGGLSGQRLLTCLVSDWDDSDALDECVALSPSAHRVLIWRLRLLAGSRGIVVSHCKGGGRQSRYTLPDNTTSDLWDFEECLEQAARLMVRANIEPGVAEQAAAFRQEAILLYKGEFCQGVGSGVLAHTADYLRNRYLQAVLAQAAYWKGKAMKYRDVRHQLADDGELTVDEESAWSEALTNYRLALHTEPYEDSACSGVEACRAHLSYRSISSTQ